MSFTPGAGTRFLVSTGASGTTPLSGPLSITGGTASTNTPVLSATQTWNNAAVTFTGWQLNVTDTASAAASLLMDLQVGGVSRFSAAKNGSFSAGPSRAQIVWNYEGGSFSTTKWTAYLDSAAVTTQILGLGLNYIGLQSNESINWSNGFNVHGAGGNVFDLSILRDAANTLAQRNGVNAQTNRLYGTFTDASNYRRLAMAMTTGGVASIAPEGAGTGASGNVLHISGLPTANPGPGILWNDAGTVKVGT